MNLLELVTKVTFDTDKRPLEAVESKLDSIGHKLEFLAAAEVVKGIFEMTERFSVFASEIGTASIAAGLSAEALQKIQFAAEQAGSSSGEVTGAMQKLTRTLYEAQNGSEEAQKSFKEAGISVGELKGFKTSADALASLSDHVKEVKDPIKKQALAMALLGRGAGNMVEFLDQGSAAIAQMGEEGAKMGAVLSNDNVKSLKDFEDAMSGVFRVVKVFAATVAAVFAPAIQKAAGAITAWYGANRQLIQTNLEAWAEKAIYAFGFVFGIVEGLIQKFTRFAAAHPLLISLAGQLAMALAGLALGANALSRVLGGARTAFGLLGDGAGALATPFRIFFGVANLAKRGLILLLVNIGTLVATAFPSLGAAFVALGTAINATPIGWLIAGFAAIVAAGQAVWVMLNGGSFKDTWLYKLWEILSGMAGKVWNFGKGIAKEFGINLGTSTASAPPAAGQVADDVAQVDAAGNVTFPGAQALAGLNRNADAVPSLSTAGAQSVTQTLNAPITVTVPEGTPAQDVANKVKEGVREHLDRQARQMQRSLRTAQAY